MDTATRLVKKTMTGLVQENKMLKETIEHLQQEGKCTYLHECGERRYCDLGGDMVPISVFHGCSAYHCANFEARDYQSLVEEMYELSKKTDALAKENEVLRNDIISWCKTPTSPEDIQVLDACRVISETYKNKAAKHPRYCSPHHAYGIILEELDELFDEVKKKPDRRSYDAMIDESADIAAAALKMILWCWKKQRRSKEHEEAVQ